jgi:hypothetical protein
MEVRPLLRFVPTAILAVAVASLSGCGGGAKQESAPPESAPVAEAAPEAPASAPPASEPPRPAPAATPPPEPIVKTIPAGTGLSTEMVSSASSKTSQIGDAVEARVTEGVQIDGVTVVPVGSTISGTITEAKSLAKIGGQAVLGVKFDRLVLPNGHTFPIVASIQQKGKSETGKDAGTIAGATAGGALLGRLLSKNDKTKGTLIGAAVGAAAGTGAAAATKGQEVELPAGAVLALRLESSAEVTVNR